MDHMQLKVINHEAIVSGQANVTRKRSKTMYFQAGFVVRNLPAGDNTMQHSTAKNVNLSQDQEQHVSTSRWTL